jgi:hypothetical protein
MGNQVRDRVALNSEVEKVFPLSGALRVQRLAG